MNDELCMFVSLYVSLWTVISLLLFGHASESYCDVLIGRIDKTSTFLDNELVRFVQSKVLVLKY